MRRAYLAALLAVWCATWSGILLPLAPQALLALHLLCGIGGAAPFAAYLGRHWWSRRRALARDLKTIQGYLALACLALIALTGLALMRWTSVPALRWLHAAATAVLLIDLAAHAGWRLRYRAGGLPFVPPGAPDRWQNRRVPWVGLIGGLAVVCAVAGLALAAQAAPGPLSQTASVPLEHGSLGTGMLASVEDCGGCHADLTLQWRQSGHAHAATDAYYQAVTALFVAERGVQAARFCAACHNPVGLIQGEVDAGAAPNAAGGAAYQARQLGVSLPVSQRAAEGVTCAICHQATRAAPLPADGALELDASPLALPTDAFARLSLSAAPGAHRDVLLRPVIKQAELCGSCHNLHLPGSGLAVEPTFDEWQASPYPARGVTCQTCHLPRSAAAKADSGLPSAASAHGGVPGAPSSLPGLSGDASLLKQAAALHAGLSPHPSDPSALLVTVTVTNSGAGHNLPTGATDLRQMWLELGLRDARGEMVWQSGALGPDGRLGPDAVQFRKVLGDANGRLIDLHRIWVAAQVLEDTTLKPLQARQIDYRVRLPRSAAPPFTLMARLLYRDVSPAFAEYALDRAINAQDLPALEMAQASAVLPVLHAPGVAGREPAER